MALYRRPARELAAQEAVSGAHICQFLATRAPARELAAQEAVSGAHSCQFLSGTNCRD